MNGRSVGHWCGTCHRASDDKVIMARVLVPFLGLRVLVYICACLFLLAVGGALMVVIIWYLWCPCGVLMIRCLSNGMEAHYYHVMLHHWLWVNGLLFVWWLPRRTKIDVTLVHCLLSFMDEDIIRTICYPPIPRSSIFGTITGIWRVFFFFGGCGRLGFHSPY